MKRLAYLTILAALVGCGGGAKTEAPVAIGADGVPAGWPAETFSPIGLDEIEAYAAALPNVVTALKAANFRPVESDPPDMVTDLGSTVEGMKAVAGVEDAIKAAGLNWDSFRVTTYKVLAADRAMVISIAEAMAAEAQGDDAEEARAEVARAKQVFDKVPKENAELVLEFEEELGLLDELEPD